MISHKTFHEDAFKQSVKALHDKWKTIQDEEKNNMTNRRVSDAVQVSKQGLQGLANYGVLNMSPLQTPMSGGGKRENDIYNAIQKLRARRFQDYDSIKHSTVSSTPFQQAQEVLVSQSARPKLDVLLNGLFDQVSEGLVGKDEIALAQNISTEVLGGLATLSPADITHISQKINAIVYALEDIKTEQSTRSREPFQKSAKVVIRIMARVSKGLEAFASHATSSQAEKDQVASFIRGEVQREVQPPAEVAVKKSYQGFLSSYAKSKGITYREASSLFKNREPEIVQAYADYKRIPLGSPPASGRRAPRTPR